MADNLNLDVLRVDFEAWAKDNNIQLTQDVNHEGYYYPQAKASWAAWQAALRTTLPLADDGLTTP